ncbi:DUF4837 family protein [Prolixibacteraceae bacterium JC049]|jgi:hypothetical protein|nr:DUF4837 family protein [Prolixibacteraceae bacterium JC049]
MKLTRFLMPVLVLAALVLSSCGGGKKGLPNISGKPGEMLVIISPKLWEGKVGTQLRQIMAQPHLALPQDEPVFKLVDVPPKAFKPIFHTTRNIIFVDVAAKYEKSQVVFQKDQWANKQAVVRINLTKADDFKELFKQKSDKILSFFLGAEKKRLMDNYSKYYAKDVDETMKKNHALSIKAAPGFRIHKDTTDFVWMSYETPILSQGIIISTFKYEDENTFTPEYLVKKYDEVLSANIPGPAKGSYMKTEDLIEPVFQPFKLNNNYAVEMRGLWEVENDFMGGPYVALSVLDPKRNRVVNLIGYIYAPKKDKRNFVRQVEAMLYSLKFSDQAINDKLYRQAEIGEKLQKE